MCIEKFTLLARKRQPGSNYYYHQYLDISARELLIPVGIIYGVVRDSAPNDL